MNSRPPVFLLLFALVAPLVAQPAGEIPAESAYAAKRAERLSVRLTADAAAIAPGKPFRVALAIDHQRGWHSYWRNSGGFSLPTEIAWQLPEGFTAGPWHWPVPERLESQGFPAFVMPARSVLVAEVTPPASLAPGGTATLKAKISGQVCKETCELFEQTPSLVLPVAATAAPDADGQSLIEATLRAAARPLDTWTASASEAATGITLTLAPGPNAAPPPTDVFFFSATPDIDGQAAQTATLKDGKLVLRLQRPEDTASVKNPGLRGVLVATGGTWSKDDPEARAREIDIPLGTPAAKAPPPLSLSLLAIAFLGGLILNLMPCVFPVLGLKVMNFVNQSGEDHRKVVLHGLVFTLGVVLSFWVLAGIIILLKSASGLSTYTWGFQLQDPRFVLAMVMMLFLFSLSLAGVFEFGVGATGVGGKLTRKSGLAGSFFSGVLATLVATPCAAPFLAQALGVALAMPPVPSFVLFTAIAMGLSLPYLLLAAFPKLVDKLPRPGAWMETFKILMAFPMFATVAALLWVLGQQIPPDAFLTVLLALVAAAMGAWIYGHWGQPWQAPKTRWPARAAAILLIGGAALAAWPTERPVVHWETWSAETVAAARKENRPVFIDFTAAWCATCKANKIRYTHDPEVIALLEKKGVLALKADFTNKDPEIAKAIGSYGRAAVPVNVLYRPGAAEPEFLPEIFGATKVIERFSSLPDRK